MVIDNLKTSRRNIVKYPRRAAVSAGCLGSEVIEEGKENLKEMGETRGSASARVPRAAEASPLRVGKKLNEFDRPYEISN